MRVRTMAKRWIFFTALVRTASARTRTAFASFSSSFSSTATTSFSATITRAKRMSSGCRLHGCCHPGPLQLSPSSSNSGGFSDVDNNSAGKAEMLNLLDGHRRRRRAPLQTLHFSSASDGGSGDASPMINIGKAEMMELLDDHELKGGSSPESPYCVMDVRTPDEVLQTGQLSPSVLTLPVQVIMQRQVFQMDADEFEEFCGFPKPDLDTTLVFSCAAGIRSVYAAQFAAQAGYSKIVNYVGGSNEWFSP